MSLFIRGVSLLRAVLPVALFLVWCSALRAQEEDVLPELEEEAILRLLFDADDYSVERGGRWSPDFEERLLSGNISDDGYCYTNLDTAMMVPLETGGDEDLSLALLVFTTHEYSDGERLDCQTCAPDISLALYEEVDGGWMLRTFRKYVSQFGAFGERGDLSAVMIGEGLYALNMEDGFTGYGYTTGSSSLISLTPYRSLDEIFSATTYDYGPEGCEGDCGAEACESYRNIERELTFVPNIYADAEYPEFYNLILTVTEHACEGAEQTHTERYIFNSSRYERVCE